MLVFQCPDSDFLLCNDDEKILNFLLQVFQDHIYGHETLWKGCSFELYYQTYISAL